MKSVLLIRSEKIYLCFFNGILSRAIFEGVGLGTDAWRDNFVLPSKEHEGDVEKHELEQV